MIIWLGYKETVISDGAISLWSFDGDSYDPVTRKLLVPDGEPRYIIDEIDNNNPAILHADHEEYLGYRLGMESLVTHEPEDQHSITFGYYGNIPAHPLGYPKSYLEIPHSSTYSFLPDGEFSIEFFMKFSGPPVHGTYIIFKKENVISIAWVCGQSSTYFRIETPSTIINGLNIPNYNSNETAHFVITYGVGETANNEFGVVTKVYVNSRVVGENLKTYNDTTPSSNINTPITIAGSSTNYWKSKLQLDQIAVYDRALSPDEVANHTSKAFPYAEYLEKDFASNIWTFSDNDHLTDFAIYPYLGSLTGRYVGDRSQIIRREPGPPGIQGSKAATFVNQGHAEFISYNSSGRYIPRSFDAYSYEWWFKTTEVDRCVLFSIQSLSYPFNGPIVQLNVRDNLHVVGSLQFSESADGEVLNSIFLNESDNRNSLNDGKWHHIVITRQENSGIVSLWLDGILNDQKILTFRSIGQPGQLIMMNSMPGFLDVNGSLSYLAFYPFDLQPHEIRARATYSITYRIRGIVTLLGVPYRARLRFYSSYTGQFIQELDSDINTGEYMATFYNNSHIDILVFDPYDLSVRYRAYGPVTPSEFDDLPINI